MTSLYLDMAGRLHWFMHVPPQREFQQTANPAADWTVAFREAGLELANFQKPTAQLGAVACLRSRVAWDGPDPLRPENNIHVEAASLSRHTCLLRNDLSVGRADAPGTDPGQWQRTLFHLRGYCSFSRWHCWGVPCSLGTIYVPGAEIIAGATRIAFLYFVVRMIVWIFEPHHNGFVEGEIQHLHEQPALRRFRAFSSGCFTSRSSLLCEGDGHSGLFPGAVCCAVTFAIRWSVATFL